MKCVCFVYFKWLSLVYVICISSVLTCLCVSIPGEPPSYRGLRPRSTSEAISTGSRDDLRNNRSRDGQNERHNGADRVQTTACISPPHQEEDIDLCPPAAGISSLDFDPMSFQCSPASATPGLQYKRDGNKWRKNAGCSSESELISSQNNNFSFSQSPDVSPVLRKGGRKVNPKPLSPKLRKKSFKTQADVQTASSFFGATASASPPPLPTSSPPMEKCEGPVADGKERRAPYQHCSPLSTVSQASALTDLSQSAQNLPDPGQHHLSLISYISFHVCR